MIPPKMEPEMKEMTIQTPDMTTTKINDALMMNSEICVSQKEKKQGKSLIIGEETLCSHGSNHLRAEGTEREMINSYPHLRYLHRWLQNESKKREKL